MTRSVTDQPASGVPERIFHASGIDSPPGGAIVITGAPRVRCAQRARDDPALRERKRIAIGATI
jgi:hypothetical protein